MRASIVITTKNRQELLPDLIASCSSQIYHDLEILLYDDASSDATYDVALELSKADSRIKVHHSDKSSGLINARNNAYKIATGEVIIVIDDDARFSESETVQKIVRQFELSNEIGAVAIPHVDVEYNNRKWNEIPSNSDCDTYFITLNYIGTAHAIRKDVFIHLGGYPNYFERQEEELFVAYKLFKHDIRVSVVDASPILHYESPKRDLSKIMYYWSRNTIINVMTFYPILIALVYVILAPWIFIFNSKKKNALNESRYTCSIIKGCYDGCKSYSRALFDNKYRLTYREFLRMRKIKGNVVCKSVPYK